MRDDIIALNNKRRLTDQPEIYDIQYVETMLSLNSNWTRWRSCIIFNKVAYARSSPILLNINSTTHIFFEVFLRFYKGISF